MKQQSQQNTYFPFPLLDKLHLAVITWNLFGSLPPKQSLSVLFQDAPDVIVFGTQECQRSLSTSLFCQAKTEWEAMLAQALPSHFIAAVQTMRGLHLAILVVRSLADLVQVESRKKLRAGKPCGLFGNKGGISIEVSIGGQFFQFINLHLAANQENSEERNATLLKVMEEMVRKDLNAEIVLMGDFNYRIDMTPQEYGSLIGGRANTNTQIDYLRFIGREQLRNQALLKNTFLRDYEEGPITFPPTYKIGVESQEYNRARVVGWTDRIFTRKGRRMRRTGYGCEYLVRGSDHRPVWARYQLAMSETLKEHQVESMSGGFVEVKTGGCEIM